MGIADYLDEGNWNVRCSLCNRKMKASQLVKNWQGMWRCPEHNEPRQPQDFVRAVPDIQTPPWVQPVGASSGAVASLLIEESDSSVDLSNLFTTTYTGTNGNLSTAGITTVVVTIQAGNSGAQVVITSLSVGTGWPAGVTTVIINVLGGGIVLAYDDSSGLSVSVRVFGGKLVSSAYTLTSADMTTGPFTIYGYSVEFGGGSISPTTLRGAVIANLYTNVSLSLTFFYLTGSYSQDYFTSITLGATTLLSSAVLSYGSVPPYTGWLWSSPFVTGVGSFPVTIV